ncbi:MAG: DUF2848 domain-containing protein [Thermodesulfobacteriota bacterium]
MITPKILSMTVIKEKIPIPLNFIVDHLICSGWVGKDRRALQEHIDELVKLGITGPSRIPIYMHLSTYLLTTDDEISVISDQSSGEIEYVLLWKGDEMWVTVGSDHTDRDVETKSIPASKQMYAKCLAKECWPWADIKDHWDSLMLRCWVFKDQEKILYQEAPLATILFPQEIIEKIPYGKNLRGKGVVIFSGTIPTKSGLIYGDAYAMEMEDPILKRSIKHKYDVRKLPQYL